MRFQSVLAVAAVGFGCVQGQLNWENFKYFPPACGHPCGPLNMRLKNCDGDGDYQNCICTWAHAKKQIPLCQACIKNGFPGNEFIQPLGKLINACDLKTTTVDPNFAAATAVPIIGAGAAAVIAGLAAL